ncbi:MAG TPA: DUF2238 domain-containing protein [Acidimicrobiia bacterium]|nr:DUF2238 domain-containing protein [Acidimicrobiia bacterium]
MVAGYGVARENRRVVAYLVVWSLLALLIRAGHRRWPLPRATIAALVAAGAVHLAGGLLPSPTTGAPIFYETWIVPGVLKFDQLAHCFISAVVTVAVFQALGHVVDPRRAGPGVRAVIAMLVCWGFGASNELFEFLSALRFPDAYVGGMENTGWDLAFNALGGLLAAIACAGGLGRPRRRGTGLTDGHRTGVAAVNGPGGGEVLDLRAPADALHVPPLALYPLGGHVEDQVSVGGGVHPGDVGVGPVDRPLQH